MYPHHFEYAMTGPQNKRNNFAEVLVLSEDPKEGLLRLNVLTDQFSTFHSLSYAGTTGYYTTTTLPVIVYRRIKSFGLKTYPLCLNSPLIQKHEENNTAMVSRTYLVIPEIKLNFVQL